MAKVYGVAERSDEGQQWHSVGSRNYVMDIRDVGDYGIDGAVSELYFLRICRGATPWAPAAQSAIEL